MAICSICKGKGFVPSKTLGKFSGKPIANCYSRCECQGDDHDYLPPLKVTDFDFSCSYTFRSFYEEQATGRPLEPLEAPPPPGKIKDVEIVVKHINVFERSIPQKVKKTGFTGEV